MDKLELTLGLIDDPENQTQKEYVMDLYQSNLAVFGSSMSGKTTVLKTLLVRMHQVLRLTKKEEIYILDYGSNLSEFRNLPYVIACFDANRGENVRRVFKRVEERLEENTKLLKGKTYLQSSEDEKPAHITLILDGANAFVSENTDNIYRDSLQRISRDGLSKGVSVVITANDTGGIGRMLSSFKRIIAFDMSKEHLSEIFGRRVERPISLKGRGMASNEDGVYEFQAYYPYNWDECTEKKTINDICSRLTEYDTAGILNTILNEKMNDFSGDLTKANWDTYTKISWQEYLDNECKPSEAVLGLDYYTYKPIKIDLLKTRSIAIYGKKSSGKTNLLSLLLDAALKIQNICVYVLEDARHGIKDPSKAPTVSNQLKRLKADYSESLDEFIDKLYDHGYCDVLTGTFSGGIDPILLNDDPHAPVTRKRPFSEIEHEFTIFIVQSRMFYLPTHGRPDDQIIERMNRFVSNNTIKNKKLFIFSDVQKVNDSTLNGTFNNWIDHAFLLDDVVRFVGSARGQKSVFDYQDSKELKEQFGKCELGDGFYQNNELMEMSKIRFIKQEEE